MNSKERVIRALSCLQPDRVPIQEATIDVPVLWDMARTLGLDTRTQAPGEAQQPEAIQFEQSTEILDLTRRVTEALEFDSVFSGPTAGWSKLDPRHIRDRFGCIYRLSDYGAPMNVDGPIKGPDDLRGFDMASKLEPNQFSVVEYWAEKMGRDKAHFILLADPIKTSWELRGGMANLLMDYILQPDLVHALARIVTDYNMAVVQMAVDLGYEPDAVIMNGDLAGEQTTLMSPKHYREFVKPYHRELVDHVHGLGLKFVKHSDGNVWPILDDLIDVGFDGFHPIQPQCMDIAEVKQHVAGRICLLGNIDVRYLLPFGSVDEVVQTVQDTIRKAAPGGGYILMSSNSIMPGCKAENVIAMFRAAREFGSYSDAIDTRPAVS